MKLNIPENKVTSHGVMSTNTFSITASAKAFKILSSSLYKDKILAIVRELSCNAYDSHVDNGNVNQPFDIHLPTILNPYFKIRDFGTGIGHDDMMTLYTTYFSSTKTDSNDFIGALGLGSKSPFSYVDSFNVTSFYNGTVSNYTAYIDDTGTPNIALMGKEPTQEPNGVEVSLFVSEIDFRSFRDKLSTVFRYFDVKPNVDNYEFYTPDEKEIIFCGEKWDMFKSNINKSMMAIQGNIGYPLASSAIMNLPQHLKEVINYGNTNIRFDIGELEVSASREELSYDERTSANIVEILSEIYQTVRDDLIKKIEDCKTYWEAQTTLGDILDEYPNAITRNINNLNLRFENKPIKFLNSIEIDKLPSIISNNILIRKFEKKGFDKVSSKSSNFSIIPYSKNVKFIINDVKNRHLKRLNQHILENNIHDIVYLVKIDEWCSDKDKVTKKFFEDLGNPDYTFLSDTKELPKAPSKARNTVSRQSCKVLVFKNYSSYGTNYYWSTHNWNYEILENPNGIIYVPAYRFNMINKHIEDPQQFKQLLKLLQNLDIIKSDTPIYGLRDTAAKQFNKDTRATFVNLFDLVNDYIKTIDVDKHIRYTQMNFDTTTYSWNNLERIKRNMNETHHSILEYLQDIEFYRKETESEKSIWDRKVLKMFKMLGNNPDFDENYSFNTLYKHFPLLKVFDHLTSPQHLHIDFDEVVLYMNSKVGKIK